jgi:hypothetical protein
MKVTKKVIAANRSNARKSTGPKTEQGKAVSALNAVKHGLYSNHIIVRSKDLLEDSAEYDLLVSSLRSELEPVTVLQECIVRKIANCIWRSRRVVDAEASLIQSKIDDVDDEIRSARVTAAFRARAFGLEPEELTKKQEASLRASLAGSYLVPDDNHTLLLSRYELRLDRQLIRMFEFYRTIKAFSPSKPAVPPTSNPESEPKEEPESDRNSEPVLIKNDETNPLVDSPPTT